MWEFLQQPAGFDIGDTGWLSFDATLPLWHALLVGLGNTLRVSLPALVAATLLGTVLALMRRSTVGPWALLSGALINTCRNVPLLVQLLMWYFLLLEVLPDVTEAWRPLEGAWLSKSGLAIPWWQHTPEGWQWSVPRFEGFGLEGGSTLTPEFLAVFLALSIYSAAFVAEVVRSGLEAVPASLPEAARTLGARPAQVFWRVVLAQALRTMVPALTNQYLNIIKNSSLAVAVGYPDLVSVGNTAINQTGRAVECISVMMLVYLGLSLLTAAVMARYNRRYAVEARA